MLVFLTGNEKVNPNSVVMGAWMHSGANLATHSAMNPNSVSEPGRKQSLSVKGGKWLNCALCKPSINQHARSRKCDSTEWRACE